MKRWMLRMEMSMHFEVWCDLWYWSGLRLHGLRCHLKPPATSIRPQRQSLQKRAESSACSNHFRDRVAAVALPRREIECDASKPTITSLQQEEPHTRAINITWRQSERPKLDLHGARDQCTELVKPSSDTTTTHASRQRLSSRNSSLSH